jgi:hypothetical protein
MLMILWLAWLSVGPIMILLDMAGRRLPILPDRVAEGSLATW